MVMLQVGKKPIEIQYKAFLLSKACFISVCCEILAICLPFALCYYSGAFWQKRDITYQQPNVNFKGEYLFLAETNINEKIISCSSFSQYNNYVESLDNCSSIKIRDWDKNYDKKTDIFQLSIEATLSPKVKVTSFHLIIPVNYTLESPCVFHMETAIVYQQFNLNQVSHITTYADLGLHQTEVMRCTKPYKIARNLNHPLIANQDDLESYFLENIYDRLAQHKTKTVLENVITNLKFVNENVFAVNLTVKYPEHRVYYKPNLWQILKFAWIQLLAVYVITSWMIFGIKDYIFMNKLVLLFEDRSILNNKRK